MNTSDRLSAMSELIEPLNKLKNEKECHRKTKEITECHGLVKNSLP